MHLILQGKCYSIQNRSSPHCHPSSSVNHKNLLPGFNLSSYPSSTLWWRVLVTFLFLARWIRRDTQLSSDTQELILFMQTKYTAVPNIALKDAAAVSISVANQLFCCLIFVEMFEVWSCNTNRANFITFTNSTIMRPERLSHGNPIQRLFCYSLKNNSLYCAWCSIGTIIFSMCQFDNEWLSSNISFSGNCLLVEMKKKCNAPLTRSFRA